MTEQNPITCPDCRSVNEWHESYTGSLGATDHHRCRYCGSMWRQVSEVLDRMERREWRQLERLGAEIERRRHQIHARFAREGS